MLKISSNNVSEFIQANKANVNIIWFDSRVNVNDEIEKNKEDLQTISNSLLYSSNFDTFKHDIESINKGDLFLIISGISDDKTFKLLSSIDKTSLLALIFVFFDNQDAYINLKEFHRKIKICGNYTELIESIKETIIDVHNQMKMFSFYDQHKQSILDLSEESAKFLWFQLFKDVILHLPCDDKAKEEMLNACRQYYRDNQPVLEQINQFNESYQKEQSIEWYTKDAFVYRRINEALRTEDLEQLYIFRYYIANLSNELQHVHESQKFERTIEHLYRGMIITKKEAETLKTSKDKLIAVNSYWSTSRSELCASAYIDEYPNNDDKIPVLFQIECDSHDKNDSVIFADLTALDQSLEEEEVLFDVGTVFKIEIINEEMRKNTEILVVQMKTSREGREVAEKYKEENRQKMKDESPTIMLCTLLKRMGKVEQSLQLLEQLSQNPGYENEAHIHNRIGIALKVKNEYTRALDHFEKAYKLIKSSKPPQAKYTALILYNRGRVYDKMKEFDKALNDSKEAIEILRKENREEDGNVAKLYSSIGRIHYHRQNFDEALEYQLKALDIRKKYLSSQHVVIAFSYSDIANIYSHQNDYEQALKYHLKALELRKEFLPTDHHTIAWSLHQIGKIYRKMGNLQSALDYNLESLSISEKYVSSSFNYLILDTLNDIISINGRKASNTLIKYQLKALEIRRKIQPIDYLAIAYNLERIGLIYKSIKNFNQSLKYYKEAIEIRRQTEPINYSFLAGDLEQIILVYKSMNNQEDLIIYYKEAVDVLKKIESVDYLTLAEYLNKIAIIYKSMNNLNDSLEYYKEVVEIREKHLFNNHDDLASSFYDLASVYHNMSDYTKALEYYNKELKIYTDNDYRLTDYRCKKANENINRIEQLIKETTHS